MSDMEAMKIEGAIHAHKLWFIRLRVAIEKGMSEFKPDIVQMDDRCEFGKWWLYGDMPDGLKQPPHYWEIKTMHARFHIEAAKVLRMALAGQQVQAIKTLEDASADSLREISNALIAKLEDFKKIAEKF